MWHWDQGHLPYFQFDALRQISAYAVGHDFRSATRSELDTATGLSFPAPATYSPWRNYSRVLKLCLLVSEIGGRAEGTPVARILARPGAVTCDEFFHFIIRVFTEPSPALRDWQPDASFRYPLLFSLKYLLAKAAVASAPVATSIDEIIGAYRQTRFTGDETDEQFIAATGTSPARYEEIGQEVNARLRRQAAESLQVIAQISYLHIRSRDVLVSLDPGDAREIFDDLTPVIGPRAIDREGEIRRLASLFEDGSTSDFFDYPHTVINDVVQSGFLEGSKVKKTHVTIERNAQLRREFFAARATATCDMCSMDTAAAYPWAERVLDVHHLLPLSSGTRVETAGTTFDDLVPVCPSCHRAIHRFYDGWLAKRGRADFANVAEARRTYGAAKAKFGGRLHA